MNERTPTVAHCPTTRVQRRSALGRARLCFIGSTIWVLAGLACSQDKGGTGTGGLGGAIYGAGGSTAVAGTSAGGEGTAGKGSAGEGSAGEGSAGEGGAGEGGSPSTGGVSGGGTGGDNGGVPCISFSRQLKAKNGSTGLSGKCCKRSDENNKRYTISDAGTNWSCP